MVFLWHIIKIRITKSDKKILEGAFRLFLNADYEGASTSDLEAEIGLTRGAIYYSYKSKEELFKAVIDRFVLNKQNVLQKTGFKEEAAKWISLKEYLEVYINGAKNTIESMKPFVWEGNNGFGGYFSLLYQAHKNYEGFDSKIYNLFFHEYSFIKAVVKNAIKTKEIRDLDAEEVAHHLRYIFIGCAFEESFNNGLTVEEVQKHLMFYYNIIKR